MSLLMNIKKLFLHPFAFQENIKLIVFCLIRLLDEKLKGEALRGKNAKRGTELIFRCFYLIDTEFSGFLSD